MGVEGTSMPYDRNSLERIYIVFFGSREIYLVCAGDEDNILTTEGTGRIHSVYKRSVGLQREWNHTCSTAEALSGRV